jgi:HPr kinase/phosphorylase
MAWVADDAVDLYRVSADRLEGRCPRSAAEPARVRGIGCSTSRRSSARRRAAEMRLKLIVHLVRKETMDREFERLPYEPQNEEILDVPVRKR